MKPAPFEYARPSTVDEACAMLAADEDARIIAGGQTLVPMMAMRLARPSVLIDIARIPELNFIRDHGDALVIGAATPQAKIETDPVVRSRLPLLSRAIGFVGHAATRARGTVGGSLVNADPAAEITLVAVTLGATLVWRDGNATHEIAACEFFQAAMVTSLPATAVLTEVRFPVWRDGRVGVGFHEINARQSDFAFVSAAAQIAVDGSGAITRAAVGIGAVTSTPLRTASVEQSLIGRSEAQVDAALREALTKVEPLEDLHVTAAYRRRVGVTLGVRAVADAFSAAKAHA